MRGEYRMWYTKQLLALITMYAYTMLLVSETRYEQVRLLITQNEFCYTGSLCFHIAETSCEL